MLYFLNAGGSRISNMKFPCVMKVIKVMKVMRISLNTAFLYICLHFSAFLYISLRFSEFLYISLQFYAFYILYLGKFDEVYRRPMDSIFASSCFRKDKGVR